MGVEFFEEGPAKIIQTAPGREAREGGMAGALVSMGLSKSVSGAQIILICLGLLLLFGSYFVFSLSSDAGARKPTDAEIKAMAALLKKQ